MSTSGSTVWRLEKYARYVLQKPGSSAGMWKSYSDSEDSRLVMTLTDTKHLVVLQGSMVLESHSLVTARAWMRGMGKNDSLLFLYKHDKGTRRFKVKFASVSDTQTGGQTCREATVLLSALFTIHLATPAPTPTRTPTTPATATANPASTESTSEEQTTQQSGGSASGQPNGVALTGEVSLAAMTQVVLGESANQLPAAYAMASSHSGDVSDLTSLPDDVISSHLRLFLADPTFPSFVAKVSEQLAGIVRECEE